MPDNKEGQPGCFAFAPIKGWGKWQLALGCGALPYLLHEKYGFRAVLVGGPPPEEAPAPGKYNSAVEYVKVEGYTPTARLGYLKDHCREIDLLLIYGTDVDEYAELLNEYRLLRPEGKTCLVAEPDIAKLDELLWYLPPQQDFFGKCDVIATGDEQTHHYLSRKWPWVIEYIPVATGNQAASGQSIDRLHYLLFQGGEKNAGTL